MCLKHTKKPSASASIESPGGSSSISSGLRQLEDQVLRGVGVDLDSPAPQVPMPCERLSSACAQLLRDLVEESVATIEQTCLHLFEGKDWILGILERDDSSDLSANAAGGKDKLGLSPSGRPSVLWAYHVLRTILTR